MISLIKFYNCEESFIKEKIKNVFPNKKWIESFLSSSHHGFNHANKVRKRSLDIVQNLNKKEKNKLKKEGKTLSKNNYLKNAVSVIEIASIFHDCGRFNKNGNITKKNQEKHHTTGTKRAIEFLQKTNNKKANVFAKDAIMHHDFQSEKLTPKIGPPKTMIGKVLQASDQIGWFTPDSLKRTIEYNESLNNPFFDQSISFKERLNYSPNKKAPDTFTAILGQLMGPCNKERFQINYALKRAKYYRKKLKQNIINLANEKKLGKQAKSMIKEIEK